MNLRERVLRGGFYLVLRQGLSIFIGLGGIILLTRLIGTANYGLYAGSLALLLFLSDVARMGVDVYLVRRESDLAESEYHQAFTLLVLSGVGLGGLGLLASPLVVRWLGDERFLAPLQAMLLFLPVAVLSKVAVARIERALEYQKVAVIELTGQLLFYASALLLAWWGLGVWGPVAGYGIWQIWALVSGCVLSRYRPRWCWSTKLLREMLRYGMGFSASIWVWQLRTLVNPLVVGRYLGPESVGYVALAIRLVDSLSFVRTATWRLAIAALAKVQGDLPRLRRALEEGMVLQVLSLGPLLAGFALLAPWLLPLLFGAHWTPVLLVYPFIALSYLVNTTFNLHSSVLYVLRRNSDVTVFHVVHIVLFAGTALLLVPRLGLTGYGLAEVAAVASYPVVHLYVSRLFSFRYSQAWPWLLAFLPPVFLPLLGLPWGSLLWIFAIGVGLSSSARMQLWSYRSYFRRRA